MRTYFVLSVPFLLLACSGGIDPVGNAPSPPHDVAAAADSGEARDAVAMDSAALSSCLEEGRFDSVHPGTVSDHANHERLWQQIVPSSLLDYEDATKYCASLELGSLRTWRLPTVYELHSLLLQPVGTTDGPGLCSPSIDQVAFPSTPAALFWSSTMQPSGAALAVDFNLVRDHASSLDTPLNVRCVTDAPVGPVADVRPSF